MEFVSFYHPLCPILYTNKYVYSGVEWHRKCFIFSLTNLYHLIHVCLTSVCVCINILDQNWYIFGKCCISSPQLEQYTQVWKYICTYIHIYVYSQVYVPNRPVLFHVLFTYFLLIALHWNLIHISNRYE